MTDKIIKFVFIVVILIFLLLYFFGSNIYQSHLREKRDLTEEQIIKFEQDVKKGVEIDLDDYIVKDKSYDNMVTNINRKISDTINKGFKEIFKYLLKNIDI